MIVLPLIFASAGLLLGVAGVRVSSLLAVFLALAIALVIFAQDAMSGWIDILVVGGLSLLGIQLGYLAGAAGRAIRRGVLSRAAKPSALGVSRSH